MLFIFLQQIEMNVVIFLISLFIFEIALTFVLISTFEEIFFIKKEKHFMVRFIVWLILILAFFSIVINITGFGVRMANRPFEVVDKVTSVDNIIDSYREFYNRKAEIEAAIKTAQQTKSLLKEMEVDYNLRNEDGSLNSENLHKLNDVEQNRYNSKKDGLQIQAAAINSLIAEYNNKAKDLSVGIFNGTGCKSIENCVELPQFISEFN